MTPAGRRRRPTTGPGITLYFTVPDIRRSGRHRAAARRDGHDPVHYESGWNSSCTDDQGFAFDLFQPRPGYEP